jgi:hypothetical protein
MVGQLLNGARDIYWQASVLNRNKTSSGRKGVERVSGRMTSFQTGHSVYNTLMLAQVDDVYNLSIQYDIYGYAPFGCMLMVVVEVPSELMALQVYSP